MADELDPAVVLVSWLRFANRVADAMGRTTYDFDDMQDEEVSAWQDAFALCQKVVAEADGVSYDTLARQVYEAYQRVMFPTGFPLWQDQSEEERLRWKFQVRHMAVLLEIVPEDDGGPEQHEESLLHLFIDKLKALQGIPA